MSSETEISPTQDDATRAPEHEGLELSLSFGYDPAVEPETASPPSAQPIPPTVPDRAQLSNVQPLSTERPVSQPSEFTLDLMAGISTPAAPAQTPPSLRPARHAATTNADEDRSAVYQVPYRPGSRHPATGALVPSSISEAVHQAIADFIAKHGPIDDYVCNALQVDNETLGRILTAEQIDAVALTIQGVIEGSESIVADVTGYGKGRILAAVAKAVLLRGYKVIFLTETSNLFSDFWRDVCDIQAEEIFGEQIILNSGPGSRIVHMRERDKSGNPIVIHKHIPKLLRELLAQETPQWPEGYSCLMATYSQLNRAKSDKAKLLQALAGTSIVICDEAHNAVKAKGKGRGSNVGTNVRAMKDSSRGVVNASATYARGVEEMATYNDAMPWLNILSGLCGFSLGRLSRPARAALGEASAIRAARVGRLIRREHDMSNMVMRAIDVRDILGGDYVDDVETRFSTVVSRLARIWRAAKAVSNDLDPTVYRNVTPSNFGSSFATLNGHYSLAVLLDAARREAIRIAREGKKYVGVIDSTQESMLAMIRDVRQNPDLVPGLEIAPLPDIRDLIMLSAYRICRIGYQTDTGDDAAVYAGSEEVQIHMRELRAILRDFPSLPISPLDYLTRTIEEEGRRLFEAGRIPRAWRVGEISGRTLSLAGDGSVVPFAGAPRENVIYGFNHGGDIHVDQLLTTRAGAVGLSAHDAVTNREQAVRHMQEIWPTPNVVSRVQMWGRIGRRGSRSEPEYSMLCSSAPGDIYAIASQGRKIAEVSAVVSGSSETLRMLQEMEDPIDHAGEVAATNFLADHPLYRRELMIGVDEDGDEEGDDGVFQSDGKEYGTILTVLRRLRLLPYPRQRQVFDSLVERREEVLTAFPREPSILEGVWAEKSSRVLDQPQGDGPPLRLVEIESDRSKPPIDSTRLRAILHSMRPQQVPAAVMRQAVETKARVQLKQTAAACKFTSATEALRAPIPNAVKDQKAYFDSMLRVIDMVPGSPIAVPGEGGRAVYSILAGITLRDPMSPCNARAYRIYYVAPGDEDVRHVTLERILRNPERYGPVHLNVQNGAIADQFDQAVRRETKVKRLILSGDPIDEVLGSIRLGGGTRVTFRMVVDGRTQWTHGIAIPRHLHQDAPNISVRIASGEMAWDTLTAGYDLTSRITGDDQSSGGILIRHHQTWREQFATLLAADQRGSWLVPALAKIAHVATSHDGTMIRLNNGEIAIQAIGRMIKAGVPLFAPSSYRDGVRLTAQPSAPRRVPNRPAMMMPSP